MKKLWLLIIFFCIFPLDFVSAHSFYIAPNGSDANSGTISEPFKTILRARNAVRKLNKEMSQDIVVYLREGLYRINETIHFNPEDSGSNNHKIIYRSFQDEISIISGGIRLKNWVLYDKGKNIYRCNVPNKIFRQLYINDKLAIRARTPNRESEIDFGPYWQIKSLKKPEIFITKNNWEAVSSVKKINEVEIVILSHYYHQRVRIGEFELSDEAVKVLPANSSGKMNKKNAFYQPSIFFFENALDFIDSKNEWFHDQKNGFVYLQIAPEEDIKKLNIEIPVVDSLIVIRGMDNNPVHDLEFRGLTLQLSNWVSPSKYGVNFTQFAQPIGIERNWGNKNYPEGLVKVAHARKIAFRNNIIRNAGASGIQFFMNVDESDIEGNEIYQIAANGIEIDAHAIKNPLEKQQSRDVAIWNNHIRKVGQDYTNGGGVLAHNVQKLIIEHNLLESMPYSCIQVGNQPEISKKSKSRNIGAGNNLIRYNHIRNCMQLHDDGGGIYTLGGIQKGTVIAENYLHDIVRAKWAGNYKIDMIYLDNNTSSILVKDNVVSGGRAAERNGSKGNTLLNNTQKNLKIQNNAGIKFNYNPRSAYYP